MRWYASMSATLDVCQCCSPARCQVCDLHGVLLLTPSLPAKASATSVPACLPASAVILILLHRARDARKARLGRLFLCTC
jgi:hypothetical protein